MYTNKKNTKHVSSSRVLHIFLYSAEKSAKHDLFCISKGSFDQMSTALCLSF